MRYEEGGHCDEVNNSPICPFIRIIPEPGGEVAVFLFCISPATERPVTEPAPPPLSSDYDSESFDFELESSQICRLSCGRRALCSRTDTVPVLKSHPVLHQTRCYFLLCCLLIKRQNGQNLRELVNDDNLLRKIPEYMMFFRFIWIS